MTRKDYEAIAKAISIAKATTPTESAPTIAKIEEAIAQVFAQDNPRFDRDRFRQACN